jgi:D-beta-D-heptose 7-phosphate kinase/D-beta-D-heptose 1-phosphate adenosyltransferase
MLKLVVIGDVCKDIFIYGECKRLSPEAPVPVFTPVSKTVNLGMSGNVMINLRTLVGYDDIQFFRQKEEITKTRYVDNKSNHMFLRVDEGEDNISRITITEEMLSQVRDADVVVISDYDKGFLTPEDLQFIGENSRFSILDTKKKLPPSILSVFNYIKVNESEYLANKEAFDVLEDKVIITLGSKGASYKGVLYPSPHPKETIDVSGAGDTFLAAFVVRYTETSDVGNAIIYANELSSIVVSKRGVTTP